MTVETFSKADFEAALPVHKETGKPLWHYAGLIKGEHCYTIAVADTNKRIQVRSSVKANGQSASTGKDSVRLWIEYWYPKADKWIPLKKLDAYTTRVPGWQGRMTSKLRQLWRLALKDSNQHRADGADEPNNERVAVDNQCSSASPGPEACKTVDCTLDSTVSGSDGKGGPNLFPPSDVTPHVSPERPALPALPNFLSGETVALPVERQHTEPTFTPSHYQRAVFDFIKNGSGHGVVSARAGSGKTTTNIAGLAYTDQHGKVALVAFNRRIAKEQARRAPDHVTACTLHSLGLKNVKAVWPDVEVEPRKLWHLLFDLEDNSRNWAFVDALKVNGAAVIKLVSLCKATMRPPTLSSLDWIADRYNINMDGGERYICIAARLVFYASLSQTDIIDYDDMIYLCASGVVGCEKFDFLFVDETQDLNEAQVRFALRSVHENGRIVACGDSFQSVYAFRGAGIDVIPNLIEALSATVMPLSISYRCPLAVVRLVNERFPEIDFEPAPNAVEGKVALLSHGNMLHMLAEGDLVLCRTNAPLVGPAFDLIRRGVKAVILGRDIGKNLKALVDKVQKRKRVRSLLDLLDALARYRRQEVAKLLAAKKNGRAATLRDQVETIVALADGVSTVPELKRRIDKVFSDDHEGVVFSSIHKAKGGEANRVFILRPDLMPHPLAEAAWELQQERNVEYVAVTRAKRELYFVT